MDARLRAYWWWLNGNVTKEAITRDLEEMKAKGFGGALICDADGSSQDGNDRAPHGPTFFSPEWRELYKHTLREADRLGPGDEPEHPKRLEPRRADGHGRRRAQETGLDRNPRHRPGELLRKLARRQRRATAYYRDLFVLAFRVSPHGRRRRPSRTSPPVPRRRTHPAGTAGDGDPDTFWVSDGTEAGQGPDRDQARSGCSSNSPEP